MKQFREFKDEAEYQHVPLEERKFTLQQRLKAGQRARRRSKLLTRAKQRALRRVASPEVLQKRAKRTARNIMRSRIAKGQNLSKMSPAQKIMLATRLERFLPKIKKMAKRLVKVKRKEELQRKRNRNKIKTPGQKG
jgi:hypothetical protein